MSACDRCRKETDVCNSLAVFPLLEKKISPVRKKQIPSLARIKDYIHSAGPQKKAHKGYSKQRFSKNAK